MTMLSNECKQLSEQSRKKFLHLLLSQQSCKVPLLSFLMLEAWASLTVDCSGVHLRVLLENKKLTDEKLMGRFLEQGVPVSMEDVRLAVRRLTPANIGTFKKVCSKCAGLDVNQMCAEASAQNKLAFMLHFVELGAKLPGDGVKIFMDTLKTKDFHAAKILVGLFGSELFGSLDLGYLLDTTHLALSAELIELLVGVGIKLNGKVSPVSVVMRALTVPDQVRVLSVLIENGVDCRQLCMGTPRSTTSLHVATDLALRSDGDTKLIEVVVASPSFEKSSKLVNEKGETPLHLAAKPHLKSAISSAVLSCLVKTNVVDPSTKDKNGKRACDYVKDDRVKLLQDAITHYNPEKKKSSKKKKKKKSDKSKDASGEGAKKDPVADSAHMHPPVAGASADADTLQEMTKSPKLLSPNKDVNYKDMSSHQKMVFQLYRLRNKEAVYFQESDAEEDEESNQLKLVIHDSPRRGGAHMMKLSPRRTLVSAKTSPSTKLSPSVLCSPSEPLPQSGSPGEFSLQGLNFDTLPWEVEVTRKVVKFFKNTKKYSPTDRVSAARVIYSIAEGKRNLHLAKPVGSTQKASLYEARITDSGRILWEKAINYSQNLTKDPNFPVYTQVIRVWEVILDHDDLDHHISHCSKQILACYDRGYLSSVRWGLRLISQLNERGGGEGVHRQEKLELPSMYTKDSALVKPKHHFTPAASTNESEYSVTTFYSFDTVSVKSMIAGSNEKRDYPFKEWQKENEIIKIDSKEAILLLGRSGTGKTTCCLYRLWNEFKNYWNPDSNTFGVKIPRKTLISISLEAEQSSTDSNEMSGDEDAFVEELDPEDPLPPEVSAVSGVSRTSRCSSLGGAGLFVASDQVTGVIEEDLHQIFVTKNYVLCDQMRKRFFCMVAGCEFLERHLEYEEEVPPNNFDKYENLSFPAFLTARQFYILLDNSIGGSDTFFKRDADGNLLVKISSLDYDHEDSDILLDLEHSDSEDDDVELMKQYSSSSSQQVPSRQHSVKWTEVTALYFKEIVWPKISHEYGKEFDPMLVWLEIQSFIKGSEFAIEKGTSLSFTEYKDVGNRMAPNFSSHRDVIYKLYVKYCRFVRNSRHSNYLFDECDLVLDLHNRLKRTGDVAWSIHSVYIDEVQDFTQAELSIFIRCCRDPNSMFFTGDTAQSIMRGIAFRFQDLRSCFHRIHSRVPYIGVPEEPLKLTINYRSHSGILKLAGSVIDLISEFFKDSIDHLPDDEGMFPGPMPVFLDSCEEKDLSLLLSTNKRECSAIEFGAHQVILVQSKEAKDRLPDILKGAIALTIFEAKGLEFDDVLLYNFFTDSLVDEKGWRVVSSYLDKSYNVHKIESKKQLPGNNMQPRSVAFNPTLHKSLNAELKYLYTAITRAKCNLWMYDSNKKNRLPMLDYWHKRNAVKVVMEGSSEQSYGLVFASNSTPKQWAAQGDNFRKRHLWEQAILCYEKAGVEYAYLAKEACAYHFIQEARQQKPQLFQNAALHFMERDELKHSVHCINGAALCLKNSKPPKHAVAAKLFEQLGDLAKAGQCYLRGRDFDNFSRVQESLGDYNSVIKSLQGKPFMRKREALMKADEYEKKGYVLEPKYTPSELSFSCARFYSDRKDKKILLEVLKYMPEHERRVKFLKEAELFKEAFEDYADSGKYSSAYRLALAKGWYGDGKGLADRSGDGSMEARFILQEAKQEYLTLPVSFSVSSVNPEVIGSVKKVSFSKDRLLQAEANLLLGMLLKTNSQCITALGLFKLEKHKAGMLEAFDRVGQYGKVSDQEVLDCSHVAKKVSMSLRQSSDMNVDVKQAVKFCGLQLIGSNYLTSPFSSIWIEKDTLLKFVREDADSDVDGMLCLKQDVKDAMAQHYEEFIIKWLHKSNLETRLQQKLQVFKLHSQLYTRRSLNRQYSLQDVSSLSLREYIQACVHLLELWVVKKETKKIDSCIAHIIAIFSPQVYIYLPQCLNSDHVHTVRISENSRKCFADFMMSEIARSSEVKDRVQINEWLLVWRASCVALPSFSMLTEKINSLETGINAEADNVKDYVPPPGFILWKSEKRYCHIFALWLNSCVELRDHSGALWAAKLAINYFLGNIAEDKRISISIMNCVDILSVHCTSVLAMITNVNALQDIATTFTVPLMYKHMVDLFTCMNCRKGTPDKTLLAACVEQVSSYRNVRALFSECKLLLIRAMGYLIGTHQRAPLFSMLKFGLNKFPDHDATRLCLILTLTLFGNLAMLKVRELSMFEDKISTILKKAANRSEKVPGYVKKVYHEVSVNSRNFSRPAFVFNLVENLFRDGRMENTLSKLIFRQKADSKGRIEFVNYQPMSSSQVKKPPASHFASSADVKITNQAILPSEKFPVTTLPAVDRKGPTLHPPFPELGQSQPLSPATAPIGSERHQAASPASSVHHSSDPVPVNPAMNSMLNPNAATYLPGLPSAAADSSLHLLPGLPQSAATSSLVSPVPDRVFYPLQSSDGLVPESSSFIPGGTPAVAVGQVNYLDYQSPLITGLPPQDSSMFPLQQPYPFMPSASDVPGWFGSTYYFQDDTFFITEEQQDDSGYNFVEYEGSLGLTQLNPPAYFIDPTMMEEGIIDEANSFCNVCGIFYQRAEVIEAENYLQTFFSHVSGQLHHDNTVSYKRFKLLIGEPADGSESLTLLQLAELKLKECKEVESDQLDIIIDALQDQIHRYYELIAGFEDARMWREGIDKVLSMNEMITRLLRTATDQARKITEISRQNSSRKYDDEDELDEFSAHYDKDLYQDMNGHGDGKRVDATIRTAEEKKQSRDKKRFKKQK